MKRPSKNVKSHIKEVLSRLGPVHGPARAPRDYDAISELVYTVLSQHTSDSNSTRAFRNLLDRFSSLENVARADVEEIAQAIWVGGLARVKAQRIKEILNRILQERGSFDLSFLNGKPVSEAKRWLMSLPGVGPKTAACVLLFALGMPALPVDTHVYRVARRLGLIDRKVSTEKAHELLEQMLRPEEIMPFHIFLIRHGRRVCKAQRPHCHECVLEDICPSSLLRIT
ncbi:MAG: endonuclease III [Chloroflexi bacterium]|nr:endonuclease III [Chloroflexota bacterium]